MDNWLFIIKGNPIVKKNSRPVHMHGKIPFIGKSKRLKEYEEVAYAELLKQMLDYRKTAYTITQDPDLCDLFPLFDAEEPFYVRYWFYRGDKRRCDCSNLVEAPQDALQQAGVIENDNLIAEFRASKAYDKENPRVEIIISQDKSILDDDPKRYKEW